MSSQVVKCWNCQRVFETTLKKNPPTDGYKEYKGINPNDATDTATKGKSKAVQIARTCPYCDAVNMIAGEEE